MEYEAQTSKCITAARQVDSKNTSSADSADKQETLPDSQNGQETCGSEEVRQIINRILTIAQEIGWLSERKVPVENDSIEAVSPGTSRQ